MTGDASGCRLNSRHRRLANVGWPGRECRACGVLPRGGFRPAVDEALLGVVRKGVSVRVTASVLA